MEIQIPVFDYSELLEEAHDRIEEKLILEGDDNIMKSPNVFVDCVCESPKMPGLTDEQLNFVINELKNSLHVNKSCLANFIAEPHFDAPSYVVDNIIESYEHDIAMLMEIIDCLEEK